MVMTVVIPDNRSRPREELRRAIYEAAIAAFRASGYERATIEAITTRAGVAKGTFFNFYKTKLDVLAEYYWQIDTRLAPLREGLDPAHPVKALARYARAVESELRREGDLLVDLLIQTMRDDAMRKMDQDSGEADARQFANFLRKARAVGRVRRTLDPDKGAALIIDVWAGAMRSWLDGGCKASLARIFTAKVEDLFQGFAPKGRTK